MRAILCPREIGRNTRRGTQDNVELSHGGASVPSCVNGKCVCCTRACSRSRSQSEEIQGDPFARPPGEGGGGRCDEEREATVARMGPYGSRIEGRGGEGGREARPSAPWERA